MKALKKRSFILAWLAAVLLICSMLPVTCFAAEKESYQYIVRVYGGEQGTVDGGDYAEYTYPSDGTGRFSFSLGSVKLKNGSKYYVKGLKLAGYDTSEKLNELSFKVTEDTDLVVAYGIKGDMVPYYINYVDAANGQKLAERETYYANDGDKPVVAYKHFEHYEPKYYNITGTVKKGGKNEWTFEYNKIENTVREETVEQTVTTTVPGQDTVITTPGTGNTGTGNAGTGNAGTGNAGTGNAGTGNAGTGNAGTGNAGTGNAGTGNAGTGNEGGNAGAGNEGGNAPAAPEPQEILDIDEGEVPLAPGADEGEPTEEPTEEPEPTDEPEPTEEPTEEPEESGNKWPLFIPGIAGLAAIAALITWYVLSKRKKAASEEIPDYGTPMHPEEDAGEASKPDEKEE